MTMIQDIDIWRAALLTVKRCGDQDFRLWQILLQKSVAGIGEQ
jgi:hypothetical protein